MPRYHKDAEKFLAEIAPDGWQSVGYTGSGHIKLVHTDGAVAFLSATPGDYRTRKNMISTLRRARATTPRRRSA